MAFVNMHIFSLTFLHFDMSLLLLTVTLRGVSNKHCLLPLLVVQVDSAILPQTFLCLFAILPILPVHHDNMSV